MQNYIILICLGYLIGSIPFSYLVSQKFGRIDIRKHGSGNTGATNVFRVLGKKAGFIAFLGDFLKGVLAAVIGRAIMGEQGALLCAFLSVIGHCYPFTLKFKGGKGVATSAGMVAAVSPVLFLIILIFQFTIIFLTKYMSLASILSAILFPFMAYILGKPDYFIIYATVFALFVIYRHWSNLIRLLNGTESKLELKKK